MYRFLHNLILLVCLALSILIVSSVIAAKISTASTDRLPLGDWSYNAMVSLAADGLVPGAPARIFQGDRLFDRIEMAQLVASVVESANADKLTFDQVALIDNLIYEFRPELLKVSPGIIARWSAAETDLVPGKAQLLGYANGLYKHDSTGDDSVFIPYRATAFMSIRKGAFGYVTAADKEQRFFHDFNGGPTLDKMALRVNRPNYQIAVGREYLNWGPSYTGSLILSDNAHAYWQVRGTTEIDFGKFIGKIKVTQFGSGFDDNDETLYLFGRRYEKWLGDRWHLGISETAKMSDLPNPLILVVPYYFYQHLFLDEVDAEFNTLYATDLTYRTPQGFESYGEFLIDDLTNPGIFGGGSKRPNKTGYTLGFYVPNVLHGDKTSTLRAEYISINPQTYEATRPAFPQLAYTHDNMIIGSPLGPNSKAIYLRCEQQLSTKLSVIAEYLNHKQAETGAPNIMEREIFSLLTAYDITPDKSISVRIAPFKQTPHGLPQQNGTEYEVKTSFAF